jgi:hypothetical protein
MNTPITLHVRSTLVLALCTLLTACAGPTEDSQEAANRTSQADEVSTPGSRPAGVMAQELTAMAGTALSPVVTESGFITLSVDGTGTNNASSTVEVLKPAGATVRKAFLASASTGFSGRKLVNGDVRIDGQAVTWTSSLANSISSWNHWADVTTLVKNKLNAAPAGRVSFTISEVSPSGIDGEVLAVIFDNPAETTTNTVVLLFGAQNIAGDTFQIGLAEPINKADPNLKLDLSLGISYGYQTGSTSEGQRSIIKVNNTTMTQLAGGQDDGESSNGALITVGGLDDTNANPNANSTGPGPRGDDELYDLRPFVNTGATQITVFTQNPSNDDNIFFGALYLASAAAVVGEGIVLGPTDATVFVGQNHTVTATLQDDLGRPLANRTVTFKVTTGPSAGRTATATSNSLGKATFTYSAASAGTDELQASFVKSTGQTATSNVARVKWLQANQAPVALCQNLVLNADATCGASGSINAGSFDPDGDAITCTQSQSTFGLGTATNVVLSCTDASGLTSSCTANVTVVDNTDPVISSCPADVTAECTNYSANVSLSYPAASDNCGGVTYGTLPNQFPLGSNVVTHSAYDMQGNSASCTSTVTVQDTLAPAISLNGGAALSVTCSRTAAFEDPGATGTDQCEGSVSVSVSGSVDMTRVGNYNLLYTAVDSAGRSTTVARVVTVVEGPDCTAGHEAGWVLTGSMWADRLLHTATLLPNGKVLVAGAFNRSTELYDVASGTFSRTGDTRVARRYHVMEQLADGKVLIAGGAQSPMGPVSAEVYDSATGVWTATGHMVTPRGHAASVRLSNGKVLVMGGVDATGSILSSSELYDPATGTWSLSGFLSQARKNHTATLLADGRVLVTGGTVVSSSSLLTSAEVYDPATGAWTTVGSMATPRTFHTATLLPNGKVLVAGGGDADFARSASVELFDPATGAFTSTASMAGARRQHTATLLNNGLVLVSGGVHQMTGIHYASELYNPATGTWMNTASMNVDRYAHTATLLQDGRVLAVGGASNHSQKSAELYTFVR